MTCQKQLGFLGKENNRFLTERLNAILTFKQGRMEQCVKFSLVKKKKDTLKHRLLAKGRSMSNITYDVSSWGLCKSMLHLSHRGSKVGAQRSVGLDINLKSL